MSSDQSQPKSGAEVAAAVPKRKKIFFVEGLQLRIVFLVAGSLAVLLLFAGFHGFFLMQEAFNGEVPPAMYSQLVASTGWLFAVGALYVAIVTMAAVFLTHRTVGPLHRLEDEIRTLTESQGPVKPLHVRDGDGMEGLVTAVNQLMERMSRK